MNSARCFFRLGRWLRCFGTILCLVAWLVFPGFGEAGPTSVVVADSQKNHDPVALLKRFRDNNADLHTLQAEFTQEKQLALLDEILVSNGRFCVRQMGAQGDNLSEQGDSLSLNGQSLLWEYTAPEVSGFVYDGDRAQVWKRERAAARAATNTEAQALAALSAQVLAWVRADPDALARQYTLTWLSPEQNSALAGEAAALPAGVRLVPRKGNPYFLAIDVRFSPSLESLHSLRLAEPEGDTTLLRFSNVLRNVPPASFCLP